MMDEMTGGMDVCHENIVTAAAEWQWERGDERIGKSDGGGTQYLF